jgi:D-alanyl-D-alanine carboxypeptidase/D-alanyl-D-alanine-endopeptidase (penicillin-binding protein 4)
VRATRISAILLLLVASVCAALGLRSSGDAAAPAGEGTSLATPVWSPRRLPQPIVDAVGAQRLQGALDRELASGDHCIVVTNGTTVVAVHNPSASLIPASTEKLLTGAAVLNELGPEFRYETAVVAAAPPAEGVVDRVWMIGAGDPGLSTPEYQARHLEDPETNDVVTTPLVELADQIVAAGVRSIPGGVAGDDSRYDTMRYLPTWRDTYRTDGQVGPIGALTVDHGFSEFEPEPVPVEDPALFAATKLTELLEARGVAVGPPAHQPPPAGAAPIATIQSPPLAQIVGSFISASDNLAGELFTRELGVRVSNDGTTAAGTAAILGELQALGVDTNGVVLIDGSGLDRGNRVTCPALLAVLKLGAQPRLRAVWDGLAVAGRRGTLVDELEGSALAGVLRGKTGSLANVTGLTALIDAGRPIAFAFVGNGEFSEAGGIALRGEIAEIIARFPDAPPADAVVPLPTPPPSAVAAGD